MSVTRGKPSGWVLVALVMGVGAIAVAVLYALAVEPNWIQVTEVEIGLNDLPRSFDGYRVALMGDFHVGGPWPGALWRVRQAVKKVNRAAPDLVLLAGDFLYRSTQKFDECVKEIQKLHPPDRVLAVLGNHDYWVDAERVRSGLQSNSIELLTDGGGSRTIERNGVRLWFVGIDDLWTCQPNLEEVFRDVPLGEAVIALSHNPDVAPLVPNGAVGLVLAAHTQGGQVWLPGIGAPEVPSRFGERYRCGLVREGGLQVYVTRGVGMIYPPVRFLCRPEVTIITLRAKKAGAR